MYSLKENDWGVFFMFFINSRPLQTQVIVYAYFIFIFVVLILQAKYNDLDVVKEWKILCIPSILVAYNN